MERKSKIIEGWLAEGREEGGLRVKRADILFAIQHRMKIAAPDSIRLAIEGTDDMKKLQEWYTAALDASTLAALRSEMKLDG